MGCPRFPISPLPPAVPRSSAFKIIIWGGGRGSLWVISGWGPEGGGSKPEPDWSTAARESGGRGGGPGRLPGEGAPPGRKLNINQSIAGSPATQQRRGGGGGRGTGERGRERGAGSGERGEEGAAGSAGRGPRGAAERRRRRPASRAGAARSHARVGPGPGSAPPPPPRAGPGRGRLAQPLGALVPARRRRHTAGAGCLVPGGGAAQRAGGGRGAWEPGLLTAPSTFDFGDWRAIASPTHRLRPPPTASAPPSNFSPRLRAPPRRGAGRPGRRTPRAQGRPRRPQSRLGRGSRTMARASQAAGAPALPAEVRVARGRALCRGRGAGSIPG